MKTATSETGVLHATQQASERRFEFGRNWSRFLELLSEERIATAAGSLKRMLEVETLEGQSFLDIGSGSGLFSLAARRLGARVHSFDCDPHSVECTAEVKRRYFRADPQWTVDNASALDENYMRSLGAYDIVYSWGVLHHTGDMWRALDLASIPVVAGGRLFIAIYNDLGSRTARWKRIKRTYNALPGLLTSPFTLVVIAPSELKSALRSALSLRFGDYVNSWRRPSPQRGMSRWRDAVDWVGGFPYEVAKPEEIFDYYRSRGFSLLRIKCGGVGIGCNEFVFVKDGGPLAR